MLPVVVCAAEVIVVLPSDTVVVPGFEKEMLDKHITNGEIKQRAKRMSYYQMINSYKRPIIVERIKFREKIIGIGTFMGGIGKRTIHHDVPSVICHANAVKRTIKT